MVIYSVSHGFYSVLKHFKRHYREARSTHSLHTMTLKEFSRALSAKFESEDNFGNFDVVHEIRHIRKPCPQIECCSISYFLTQEDATTRTKICEVESVRYQQE